MSEKAIWKLAFLPVCAVLLVYANSWRGEFISDDQPIVVENSLIRGEVPLARLFSSTWWDTGQSPRSRSSAQGGLYRPLTVLSFAANYRLGGLDPLGYHLVNTILHAGVCALAFFLFMELGLAPAAAAFAASAFAVLPVHAEAVDWVVGRAELMAAFFVLVAWLSALRAGSWKGAAFSCCSFLCALLSKENSAAFLPALLVCEPVFGRRPRNGRLNLWAALAVTLLFYLEWRYLMLGGVFVTGGGTYFRGQGTLVVALTMSKFLLRHYLWPMISGLGLCADYSRPSVADASLGDGGAWAALALITAGAVWAGRRLWRRGDLKALGLLLFLVLLFPVSNILFKIDVIGDERLLYLPSLGFCLALGALAGRRRWALAAGLLVLAWWGCSTWQRNKIWRSESDFWLATAEAAPQSPRAQCGLAVVYDRQGRREDARDRFQRALALEPKLEDAAYGLGKSYFETGDFARAKTWFLSALALAPRDSDVLCFLGLIAQNQGDLNDAEAEFRRALELSPLDSRDHLDLGLLLYRRGRVLQAVDELKLYLRLAPAGEDTGQARAFILGLTSKMR